MFGVNVAPHERKEDVARFCKAAGLDTVLYITAVGQGLQSVRYWLDNGLAVIIRPIGGSTAEWHMAYDPQDVARQIIEWLGDLRGSVGLALINEPHDGLDRLFPWLEQFRQHWGGQLIAPNFAVAHPLEREIDALAGAARHYHGCIGMHVYAINTYARQTLPSGWTVTPDWYREPLDRLAAITDAEFVITECGSDRVTEAGLPHGRVPGWDWGRELGNLARAMRPYRDRISGVCVFGYFQAARWWADYDVAGQAEQLADGWRRWRAEWADAGQPADDTALAQLIDRWERGLAGYRETARRALANHDYIEWAEYMVRDEELGQALAALRAALGERGE